jgi:hypothetical protein
MEHNNPDISSATKQKIRQVIRDEDTTNYAIAKKAGIPNTTFDRKLRDTGPDFTLRELGQIAEALDRQLVDLLPSELLNRRAA